MDYDEIGRGYGGARRTDPRIAQRIWAALGDAKTVLNVGAGTGNYEPPDREVLAVEPSSLMRAQRPPTAAPCIDASAEVLPFEDETFDAAMAILTDHHWRDPIAGWRELRRVARRVVVFQWDNELLHLFWLVRDYMPEFQRGALDHPSLTDRAASIGATMEPVPVPADCEDGFFAAYWRRPLAYLDDRVRRGSSVWAQVGQSVEARVVGELAHDLETGAWEERNRALLTLEEAELGARLVVAG